MREQVDMCVAVGGEHSDAAILANQPVPDGEPFLFFGDVAEGICCRGVE